MVLSSISFEAGFLLFHYWVLQASCPIVFRDSLSLSVHLSTDIRGLQADMLLRAALSWLLRLVWQELLHTKPSPRSETRSLTGLGLISSARLSVQ